MLFSIAIILTSGLFSGWIFKKIKFPSLFGMILSGILIGPYCLNLVDPKLLNISAEIRKIALIVILLRAGLKLDLNDLKKAGRPAVLMCFLPAAVEIAGMILLAPVFLGLSVIESAVLGSVIAAVSPAVVVPKMIKLIDENKGTEKAVPQMILSGASVDDVFVIVMFTTFTALAQGKSISFFKIAGIPVSILTGIMAGFASGLLLSKFFEKIKIDGTVKILVMLSISFFLVFLEDIIADFIPFASLISVMTMGIAVKMKQQKISVNLSGKLNKIWIPSEIFLFVLVGTSVALPSVKDAGLSSIILLAMVLVFRMTGVFLCTLGTNLNIKERVFCMLSYTPKATVQAAIGGLPLSMGLDCGQIVLTVSVIAILITAPLGSFAIEATYKKLL